MSTTENQTESADGQSRLTEVLERLLPCPFCGGSTFDVVENGKVWTGMKYSAPVSVSVRHWCNNQPGQPSRAIDRIGRDMESAIEAWNMRANAIELTGRGSEAPEGRVE